MQIFIDAQNRPNLFEWVGPISEDVFMNWLKKYNYKMPHDLIDFYLKTGGGTIFESEVFLQPFPKDENENLADMNEYYWEDLGMPKNWLLFQLGVFESVVDMDTLEIYTINTSSFEIYGRYSTFDEWYLQTVWEEFHERYYM